ncbi:hypothetical protein BIV60_11455 [Bacillus sp. MUM 116]|uniref:YolD-like family protein n=1 Tax=Bacillus sp. MUM 116 TaxID=1678002 RepID=UPI0008F5A8FF|nr:YolD-like family protein [Bacillus sp. MUM 116]OIK14576.1 hypothetical protein BIV60_11455 [Bacillus sp. MUM 116]
MIRDRGKIKWQSAFFMPEHVKMLSEVRKEELKVKKPILDEYQIEEFEQKILLAIEYSYQLNITILESGFIKGFCGVIQRLDELNKIIYLQTDDFKRTKLRFDDIVGIEVKEKE